MERSLRIESYRNIGFKDEKPYRERLVLNNSLKKGELGDLVILIGANNSGKSNVLSALETFGKSQLQERDVTDLYMEEACRKPTLTLFARKNGVREDDFSYKKTYGQKDEVVYPESENKKELKFITLENFFPSLQKLVDIERSYFGGVQIQGVLNACLEKKQKGSFEKQDLLNAVNELFSLFNSLQRQTPYGRNLLNYAMKTEIVKEYNSSHNIGRSEILNEDFSSEYGYNFLPNIISYKEMQITNSDLKTDCNKIFNSRFFLSVLKSIDFESSSIQNAYHTFKKQNNRGVLSQLQNKLNNKLNGVSEKFI